MKIKGFAKLDLLSTNEKSYLLSSSIIDIALIIFGVFINFYLWDKTANFTLIIYYNLGYFISVPISSVIVGYLCEKRNKLLLYKIGLVLLIFYALLLITLTRYNTVNIFSLGFIYGFIGAFRFIPNNTLFYEIVRPSVSNILTGINSVIYNGINLVVPFIFSLIIVIGGNYKIVFIIGVIATIVSVIFLGKVKTAPHTDNDYEIKKVFRKDKNKDKWLLFGVKFFEGIWSGVNITLLSILSLVILGGIGWWGAMQVLLSVITIISLFVFSKSVDYYKNKFVILPISTLYFFISVVFAINLSIPSYILFAIVHTTTMAIFWCVLRSLNGSILRSDNMIDRLRVEYNVVNEIPLAIGRILPLFIMLLLDTQISIKENIYIIAFFIILMGSMPYFESLMYTKTKLLREKL